MAKSKAEADHQQAVETKKLLARADAITAQTNQAIDSLSSSWAILVEDIVGLPKWVSG
ncbi:hypothetical protein [Leptothoe spongobia]|uniref:Uncharacterized protein n=1 Tax=Leptothoe spongobia TAU-MAC 1115 TaxID=1967444 RepID=A0A947GG94_9CYAN|nr:hypothetical protein [Leptothoe spongobia]MBT9314244.1 hypothetical protein [Leptothoe spongobia TAU-MAC 1115]